MVGLFKGRSYVEFLLHRKMDGPFQGCTLLVFAPHGEGRIDQLCNLIYYIPSARRMRYKVGSCDGLAKPRNHLHKL